MEDFEKNFDLETKLRFIMQQVFEVQKFAETKNGVVLALTGACIVGILRFFGSATGQSSQIAEEWFLGLGAGISLFSIACIILIISFIPQIFNVKGLLPKKKEINIRDNLLFFGDLYKYDSESLIGNLLISYKVENSDRYMNVINISIATQIIEYSKIALNKFIMFKLAAWILLAGILSIFIVSGISHLFIK